MPKPITEPAFEPRQELLDYSAKDWEELTRETFDVIFKNSAVKRAGFDRFKQSIGFLS